MKKQRGLKRYFQKLEHQNQFDEILALNIDNPRTWPKNWHLHFDYDGLGNHSFKKRKPHLDKLFKHFDFLADRINRVSFAFNLYAVILDFQSSSDAIFLHVPDFENGQLPFRIEDLSLETTLKNEALNRYILRLDGYEIRYGQARQAFCLIYKNDVRQ